MGIIKLSKNFILQVNLKFIAFAKYHHHPIAVSHLDTKQNKLQIITNKTYLCSIHLKQANYQNTLAIH